MSRNLFPEIVGNVGNVSGSGGEDRSGSPLNSTTSIKAT